MTRQPKNEAFVRTSFLQGANAAYIEEMQAQYARNPGSVSDEWRHFFASLQEEQPQADGNGAGGPSWARPLQQIHEKSELTAALTGDWGGVERSLRHELRPAPVPAGSTSIPSRPCAQPRTAFARSC